MYTLYKVYGVCINLFRVYLDHIFIEYRGDIVNKRKFLIGFIALVFIIVIIFLISSGRPGKVESITTSLANFEERILGVGTMQAGTEIQIKSEVSGTVLSSDIKEGSSLLAGDVILVIDGADQQFVLEEKQAAYLSEKAQFQNLTDYQLPTAKGTMLQAESDKKIALNLYNDAKVLYAQGAISSNALLDAENAYQLALSSWNTAVLSYNSLSKNGSLYLQGQAQVESAKASFDKAQAQLGKYSIKATGKSILLKKYVEAGAYVQPGQSLADIGTLDKPYISTELDERYFPYVKPGMEVFVFVDSSSKFKGKISSVSPKINDATGGFSVQIEPTDTIPYKAANLTVNIEISLINVPNAISLPESYIVRDGSKPYVWIYKGGAIRKTEVVADPALSGNVQIKSGLIEGDIVVKPQVDFVDGQKVSV